MHAVVYIKDSILSIRYWLHFCEISATRFEWDVYHMSSMQLAIKHCKLDSPLKINAWINRLNDPNITDLDSYELNLNLIKVIVQTIFWVFLLHVFSKPFAAHVNNTWATFVSSDVRTKSIVVWIAWYVAM